MVTKMTEQQQRAPSTALHVAAKVDLDPYGSNEVVRTGLGGGCEYSMVSPLSPTLQEGKEEPVGTNRGQHVSGTRAEYGANDSSVLLRGGSNIPSKMYRALDCDVPQQQRRPIAPALRLSIGDDPAAERGEGVVDQRCGPKAAGFLVAKEFGGQNLSPRSVRPPSCSIRSGSSGIGYNRNIGKPRQQQQQPLYCFPQEQRNNTAAQTASLQVGGHDRLVVPHGDYNQNTINSRMQYGNHVYGHRQIMPSLPRHNGFDRKPSQMMVMNNTIAPAVAGGSCNSHHQVDPGPIDYYAS